MGFRAWRVERRGKWERGEGEAANEDCKTCALGETVTDRVVEM